MSPERWQQIDQLFHSALERDGGERAAFLAQACLGDERLRDEVESLLASHEQAASFIETPASDAAAGLFAERQARLKPGTMLNRYKILDLIGEGGMGDVYLAQDMRLGRKVALKLLSTYLSNDGDRLHRFEQEARAASALSHGNVCVVHEVGEAEDGRHYIVMEYVEGVTLRDRMADARMKLSEVLDTAVQVAFALTAAHKAGIVHRDIKPENVILRPDGDLKVLDFGLAKLTESPAFATDSEAPTRVPVKTNPGMVMGTVQYMSPEQARGKEVDARTDIWSFGVVLYEMVTGRVPFEGETPSHVIVSLMEHEFPPLTRYSEVPAELERIINKALRKNKEERYQTASDLALDLKSLKQELEVDARLKRSLDSDGSDRETRTSSGGQTALDSVHASAARTVDIGVARPTSSAEYLVGEIKRHKRGVVLTAAAVVIAVTAVAYFYVAKSGYFAASGEAIDSVAVLPFVNVSNDPNTEYLSDGISDSIINSLSQLPTLKVMSLNSVLPYKGKQMDSQAVGKALNVRAVLMGRLTKQGDSLVISTELVDVRDNRRLWGEQYNRKLSDIIVVQTEIAREISENLRLRLSSQDKQQLAKRYTENTEAYQLYLLGRYHHRKLTKEGFEKALDYFQQAINKDPAYAPAYVGVAVIYSELGLRGLMPPKEAQQKAEAATLKALQLDDTLAEAHASLAYIKKRDWDWSAAEKEYKRALELNPGSADANSLYASYLRDIGRPDEALPYAKRAYELDGLSPKSLTNLGEAYLNVRKYDQAIELYLKAIEMDPNFAPAHAQLGRVYLKKGMYKEAIEELQKAKDLDNSPERQGRFAYLAYAYAVSGKRAEAQKMLDELKGIAKQRYIPPYNFALIYAGLGDKNQAFAWLEKAYEEHAQQLAFLKSNWMFDSLRSDPRFTDLLRRVGLAQ